MWRTSHVFFLFDWCRGWIVDCWNLSYNNKKKKKLISKVARGHLAHRMRKIMSCYNKTGCFKRTFDFHRYKINIQSLMDIENMRSVRDNFACDHLLRIVYCKILFYISAHMFDCCFFAYCRPPTHLLNWRRWCHASNLFTYKIRNHNPERWVQCIIAFQNSYGRKNCIRRSINHFNFRVKPLWGQLLRFIIYSTTLDLYKSEIRCIIANFNTRKWLMTVIRIGWNAIENCTWVCESSLRRLLRN